jgi:succinate dehydrogenase/fumarate reductase flavoprotein subunit
MKSEHALLDADGDGTGTAEPDGRSGDGLAASGIYFGAGGASAVAADAAPADASPELRALYARRSAIQEEIDALRARRDSIEAAAYERELERLLVELATVTQAIRTIEGGAQ